MLAVQSSGEREWTGTLLQEQAREFFNHSIRKSFAGSIRASSKIMLPSQMQNFNHVGSFISLCRRLHVSRSLRFCSQLVASRPRRCMYFEQVSSKPLLERVGEVLRQRTVCSEATFTACVMSPESDRVNSPRLYIPKNPQTPTYPKPYRPYTLTPKSWGAADVAMAQATSAIQA